MRICPKCGYIDPPYWKHTKWSFYIDGCTRENFQILKPELAARLKNGGDIVEDKDFLYRLTVNKLIVLRKAKIDFSISQNPFGSEGYEKGSRQKTFKMGAKARKQRKDFTMDLAKYWSKYHPNQKRLLKQHANLSSE